MSEWTPIKPEELSVGTRFRLMGKKTEYVVTGAVTSNGDGTITIPTKQGNGRLKRNTQLEYKPPFA